MVYLTFATWITVVYGLFDDGFYMDNGGNAHGQVQSCHADVSGSDVIVFQQLSMPLSCPLEGSIHRRLKSLRVMEKPWEGHWNPWISMVLIDISFNFNGFQWILMDFTFDAPGHLQAARRQSVSRSCLSTWPGTSRATGAPTSL